MAKNEPNTVAIDSIAVPFGLPRLDVPDELILNERGYAVFRLNTDQGAVNVQGYWREWECRGTVSALIAGGLLRPEWCPGLPGNNKTRQPVFFDADGPRLHVGQRGGPRYDGAHIIVTKCSKNTFVVAIPMRDEHSERIESLRNQRCAREEVEQQRELQEAKDKERLARRNSETPADVKADLVSYLSAFQGLLSSRLRDSRFRNAGDVANEVNQHIEAMKQAILARVFIPAGSSYQRHGNVVYLPDQGRLALAVPAA
jgi:hypothetical protein